MCRGTGKISEFEYIQSMAQRYPADCAGPLVKMSFTRRQVEMFHAGGLESDFRELLWSGFVFPRSLRLSFRLCAAHWMDISYALGVRAYQARRPDWLAVASLLLTKMGRAAAWDLKEISNLLHWQRLPAA